MARRNNDTGRTLRILVVDTHEVMRRRVVELLRQSTLGAEVYQTGSSLVALDMVAELDIDALVIDSGHFGNPEGVALARALRRVQPPIGIVLLTALDVSALPHRFMPVLDAELVGKHEMNEHLAPALQRVIARLLDLEGSVPA